MMYDLKASDVMHFPKELRNRIVADSVRQTIMSEYTESDLDIIASIDDGIAPFNWRNNSTWFGGTMIKPLTDVAIAYCGANGHYFDAPNAYFVEGWEDGDCEDCKVIGIGTVPPLGDLPQSTLTEIWDEMFTNPNVTEAPYKHIETFNESVERKVVGEMAAKAMTATFKPRPKMITDKEALAIADMAETATVEEVKAAYYRLMINAPCWAFSEDENDQRQFLAESRDGKSQ